MSNVNRKLAGVKPGVIAKSSGKAVGQPAATSRDGSKNEPHSPLDRWNVAVDFAMPAKTGFENSSDFDSGEL